MNIKKYLMLGGVALSLGLTTASCVGDLDIEPIDPSQTYADPNDPTFVANALAQCYANLIAPSTSGPGDSNISAPDAGMSTYHRLLFTAEEFSADEAFWIWKDNGLDEIITNTTSAGNLQIEMAYSRIYQHIAVCNSFMYSTEDVNVEGVDRMRAEARTLRAFSYFNVCNLWGNSPFSVDAPDGQPLPQLSRKEIYNWLVSELNDIVSSGLLKSDAPYGRIGQDAAEALLARVYLNAEVFCGGPVTDSWKNAYDLCTTIIRRHQGTGYNGSGLASNYLGLFAKNNRDYAPGGTNADGQEILWTIPCDADHLQSYGGSTFLLAGSLSAGDFGCLANWSCMTAREQLSNRFTAEPYDVRWSQWITSGRTPVNQDFSEYATAGYQAIKWVNWDMMPNGSYDMTGDAGNFTSCDVPLIRLADIYLMRAECYFHGQGTQADALADVNLVRSRAGVTSWNITQLTPDNLLDERSRELYFECTRRTDLIRFNRYVGANQMLWSWKGNAAEGTTIQSWRTLMPIPTNILAAQPELVQNEGY